MILNVTNNNKNSWKFVIKYISDNLCSKLGYKLNEIKNKEINELNPDSLQKCYDFNILEKIRLGNIQIILKKYLLLNKKKHVIIANMIGIVVFDGYKLKLFFKVYPYNFSNYVNKQNLRSKNITGKKNHLSKNNQEECCAFINKKGNIFAITQLFEEYFCLNLYIIKKYKINLLKDILKIESIEGKDIFKKNLYQIYENISSLNFNLMQNLSEEEYSKNYKKIKEIQKKSLKNLYSSLTCFIEKRQMPKNNREMKIYYCFNFSIELNDSYISFENFFEDKKEVNKFFIYPSGTKIGEFVNNLNKQKKKSNSNKFEINKNQNEVLIKIRQIQILSIKHLISIYNIPINDILDLTLKEKEEFNEYNSLVEKETNYLISLSSSSNINMKSNNNNAIESIDNINKFFKNRAIEEPYSPLKRKYSYSLKIKLYILIIIWFLLTVSFIILQTLIIYFRNHHSQKISELTNILINSLITRNIIYSFVNSLVSIQYIVNGLHNNIIDNGFNNSILFHKKNIYDRVRDFLYFFKEFERQEKYLVDYNEIEVINIFFKEFDYISIKSENLTIKHSLNSILAMSHLYAYQVIENDIEPFLFNISYYDIENRELLGESAYFQFVFDNYFCHGKYTWDEVDNLIYHHIKTNTTQILNLIYLISAISGISVVGIFSIQSIFYFQFDNQIYAKYYINYNYLQFFNALLLKKANLIKDFISNTDIENLYYFSQKKITFENNIRDNNNFKNNYMRINNKLPIIIKPYKIKELIVLEDNRLQGVNESSSMIMNSTIKHTNSKVLMNDNPKQRVSIKNEKKIYLKRSKKDQKKSSQINTTNNTTKSKLTNDSQMNYIKNLLNDTKETETKKDLQKPSELIIYLIFISFTVLSLIIFFIINILLIQKTLNTRIKFTFIIKILVETVCNNQEILNIYAITLLKGKVMKFKYKSHGYLNSFKELDYINNLEEHNILEEVIAKKEFTLPTVSSIIAKEANLFPSLGLYLYLINSPGACEFYANFYFENKDYIHYSSLYSFDYDPSDLIQECNNISFGVNKEGITSAASYLLNSVIDDFIEFTQDEFKEKHFVERVNDEKFIGMWMEIDLIYDKVIINLVICWQKDLIKIQNQFDKLNYLVFILMMIFIVIVFIVYIIFFPVKTLKKDNIINKIDSCLYNTIMF